MIIYYFWRIRGQKIPFLKILISEKFLKISLLVNKIYVIRNVKDIFKILPPLLNKNNEYMNLPWIHFDRTYYSTGE